MPMTKADTTRAHARRVDNAADRVQRKLDAHMAAIPHPDDAEGWDAWWGTRAALESHRDLLRAQARRLAAEAQQLRTRED